MINNEKEGDKVRKKREEREGRKNGERENK